MNITAPADLQANSLDAAVLVPCYDERLGVLPTLASIAAQEGIEGRDVALVVVINNARNATAEVLASNRKTQALLDALMKGEIPSELLNGLEVFINPLDTDPIRSRKTPKALCQTVLDARLRLITCDLWSEGNAPEICNVGMARDTGGRVALPFLKEDGLLAWTDADSIMAPHYLKTAFNLFENDEKLGGATGPVIRFNRKSEIKKNPGLKHADDLAQLEAIINWIIRSMIKRERYSYLQKFNGQTPSREANEAYKRVWALPIAPHLSGSNTVTRARLFHELGGIKHWDGAEDVEFGYRVLGNGSTTKWDKDLAIATEYRVSERTAKGHCMGFYVQERAGYNGFYEDWEVPSIEADMCEAWLKIQLDLLRKVREQGKEVWERTLKERTGPPGWAVPLTTEELDLLWDTDAYTPAGYSVWGNSLALKEIREMGRKRHPDITIRAFLQQIRPAFERMDVKGGHNFTKTVMKYWDEIMNLFRDLHDDLIQLVKNMHVGERDASVLESALRSEKLPATSTEVENDELFKEVQLALMLFHMDAEFRNHIDPFFQKSAALAEWFQSLPEWRKSNEFLAALKTKLEQAGEHHAILVTTRMASIVLKNIDVLMKEIARTHHSIPDLKAIKRIQVDVRFHGGNPQESYRTLLKWVKDDMEWLKKRIAPYAILREQLNALNDVIELAKDHQPDSHNPAAPGSAPWIEAYKQSIQNVLEQMDKVEEAL